VARRLHAGRWTRSAGHACQSGGASGSIGLVSHSRAAGGGCPSTELVAGWLDPCGYNQVYDARLIADRLFSATATKLDIAFSRQPDFRNTAFELNYVETLTVSGGGMQRTMSAGMLPGSTALADLYQITGRSKVFVGRYNMPLSVTVTEN
jgi:hypothetical protein